MTGISELTTPITGVYILDPSGIPLFARYYHGEVNRTDSTLLGGFFSAIEIFVKTNLDGMLSDIGLSQRRFFFHRTENDFIVVIISYADEDLLIKQSTLKIVKLLQNTVTNCFKALNKIADQNYMRIDVLIENLGTSMDSFILESSFEFIDIEDADQTIYDELVSEQLSDEILDEIINQIKSN